MVVSAVLAESAVLVESVVLAVLAVPVESVVLADPAAPEVWVVSVAWAVPVAPATSGNTIQPIEVVRLMVIEVPRINSAARPVVIL